MLQTCKTHGFHLPRRWLDAGEVLYKQHEASDTLYFIREGILKTEIETVLGNRRVHELYGEGEFLGLAALERVPDVHHESAVALGVCVLEPFDPNWAFDHKVFKAGFASALGAQLRRERERYARLELPVKARVAAVMIELTERFGRASKGQSLLTLALTHDDLAGLAHTARATVTATLQELRKQNAVVGTRGVYHVTLSALERALDNYVLEML